MSDAYDVAVTGVLSAGPFVFEPAREDPNHGLVTTSYAFDGVTAHGVEFAIDEVRFMESESEFDQCTFRQDARITKANRSKHHYSFGVGILGWQRRSVYRNCTFDHVDFGLRGGGFTVDEATFEGCTFNHCAFRDFRAERADFVDCTFVGTITNAWFYGQADPFDGDPRQNTFSGNDFSKAHLRRVEFRNGVDLRSCVLPDGPEYLRIDDFLAKAQQARAVLVGWPKDEREDAEFLLRLYEERWSEPFFCWRGALARPDSPLWPLLESL
jgi:hypothetical protein